MDPNQMLKKLRKFTEKAFTYILWVSMIEILQVAYVSLVFVALAWNTELYAISLNKWMWVLSTLTQMSCVFWLITIFNDMSDNKSELTNTGSKLLVIVFDGLASTFSSMYVIWASIDLHTETHRTTGQTIFKGWNWPYVLQVLCIIGAGVHLILNILEFAFPIYRIFAKGGLKMAYKELTEKDLNGEVDE